MYHSAVAERGLDRVAEGRRVYDATYEVSSWHVILFHSRSGARGSGQERNTEYKPGLVALLRKLAARGGVVREIRLASKPALRRPLPERILRLEGLHYPLALHEQMDFEALADEIGRAGKELFRAPGSKPKGGNPTRTIEIVLDEGPWATAEELRRFLSGP